MKKRIICLILVVVMLALSLVSCGYSYTKDDLSKYATFDKENFEKAIAALVIENGTYETDKRDVLQLDNINEALAKKVDTAAKLYEGKPDSNDKLYYSYYITFDDNGTERTVIPTYMETSKALNMQFGLSTTEGYRKDLEAKILEGGIDLKDYAYSISTSGTSSDGQTAYISYTVSTKKADGNGTDDFTYKYIKVKLDKNSTDEVIKTLTGASIGTNVTVTSTDKNKTYSNVKINWVINETKEKAYKEIVLDPIVVYTEKTELELTDSNGKKVDLKDKELTYHVCPVYFLDVEDFTAESVLRTLLSTVSKDSFDIFADHEALIKTFNDKVKAHTDAKTALSDAQKALTTEKENLEEIKGATGDDKADEQSIKDAEAAVAAKEKAVEEAEKKVDTADKDVVTAMDALFRAVGEKEKKEGETDTLAVGKAAVVAAHKESVHKTLLSTYNKEINDNLAKALWEAMKANTKVTSTPEKAVNEVFDRLMEGYEYDFNNQDFKEGVTNYKQYGGSFQKYLIAQKAPNEDYKAAEKKVRTEAENHVKEIIVIYFVAEKYGMTYTDEELKEYKKDGTGLYDQGVYYYGEANTLAAFQFDKMFDKFLEHEEDEKTGEVTYKNELIKFSFKAAEDKDSE